MRTPPYVRFGGVKETYHSVSALGSSIGTAIRWSIGAAIVKYLSGVFDRSSAENVCIQNGEVKLRKLMCNNNLTFKGAGG